MRYILLAKQTTQMISFSTIICLLSKITYFAIFFFQIDKSLSFWIQINCHNLTSLLFDKQFLFHPPIQPSYLWLVHKKQRQPIKTCKLSLLLLELVGTNWPVFDLERPAVVGCCQQSWLSHFDGVVLCVCAVDLTCVSNAANEASIWHCSILWTTKKMNPNKRFGTRSVLGHYQTNQRGFAWWATRCKIWQSVILDILICLIGISFC